MGGRPPLERSKMKLPEILELAQELMQLKDWTRDDLARELGFKSRNIIDRWFMVPKGQHRTPLNEHVTKMQVFLTDAREAKIRAWAKQAASALTNTSPRKQLNGQPA